MAKNFPKFQAHNKVSCFNCGGDFNGSYYRDSGNCDSRGKYVQDCCKCQMSTWYDLKKVKRGLAK